MHPFVLPDHMDVFNWSLPFVSEKVMEILYNILIKGAKQSGLDTNDLEEIKIEEIEKFAFQKSKTLKPEVLRSKIGFVGKVMKMQTNLRENREFFIQLKGMCPDNKIPRGLLLLSKDEIINSAEHFIKAKAADAINEKRPN
mmetsp:Transcript_21159/g.15486  ORF Transcript_21159/g.15486 Transcript_21159/m.15486 type:complete len:141 (+) Transcript_21159:987-1409(+)